MKKVLYISLCMTIMLGSLNLGHAQAIVYNDQNPRYMESQRRYTHMADSINAWHGTTPQETYKAIDYLVDKREAKEARKAFRRELRMERARSNYYGLNNYSGYSPAYYGYYDSYYGRNYWGNHLWNTLPLALTLGYWWR